MKKARESVADPAAHDHESSCGASQRNQMWLPRIQFRIRTIMIAVAITAIWLYIIAQSVRYQAQYVLSSHDW